MSWQDAMQWGAIIANALGSATAIGLVASVKRSAIAKARRRAASDRKKEMGRFEFRLAFVEECEFQRRGPRIAEGTESETREAV